MALDATPRGIDPDAVRRDVDALLEEELTALAADWQEFSAGLGVDVLPEDLPGWLRGLLVGRGKRLYLVAAAIRIGGERAERALHRYIEPIGWAVLALLVAGVGWLLLRGHGA